MYKVGGFVDECCDGCDLGVDGLVLVMVKLLFDLVMVIGNVILVVESKLGV